MILQLKYFTIDISRMLGRNKWRLLTIWTSRVFWGIFIYRFERSLYLICGKSYSILRIPLLPLFLICYWYSNMEIHYQADIEGGIIVLHPSLGIVISGRSTIGKNITFVGGNCIGLKDSINKDEDYVIGDNNWLGANAVIIGPIKLGNNINIGASACVVKSFPIDNITLVGVPAKIKC
jgi:serine O-acetyltransferase